MPCVDTFKFTQQIHFLLFRTVGQFLSPRPTPAHGQSYPDRHSSTQAAKASANGRLFEGNYQGDVISDIK